MSRNGLGEKTAKSTSRFIPEKATAEPSRNTVTNMSVPRFGHVRVSQARQHDFGPFYGRVTRIGDQRMQPLYVGKSAFSSKLRGNGPVAGLDGDINVMSIQCGQRVLRSHTEFPDHLVRVVKLSRFSFCVRCGTVR